MNDVVVGAIALVVGALFCFRGYLTMRVIIPIWAAFAGFVLGASVVSGPGDDPFLQTALGWIVGLAVGTVFALLAYLYYEVSVMLAMAAAGFALGSSILVALGVTWSWVIVLVGLAAGVALGLAAIAADLPMALLTVLTAAAGASTMVGGAMLIAGVFDVGDVTADGVALPDRINDDWWIYVLWMVLAVSGLVVQIRTTERLRGSLREQWTADGPRRSAPNA